MSKKKLVSILLSAVLCFGMLGGTFVASAESVSVSHGNSLRIG